MGEGNIFTLCVSPHLNWGGGWYPSQVWMVGGGTPARSGWWRGTLARSGWWGVPQSGLDGGGYPSQVLMVGGVPQPGFDGGGYPSQVWMMGVPQPGLDGGGVPQPGLDAGEYPNQVLMVGGYWVPPGLYIPLYYPGYPPPSRPGWGTPHHHGWMWYPLPWLHVVPPPMTAWGTSPHQHSEHFLRGGRYASCVHTGGLSCYKNIFPNCVLQMTISFKPFLHIEWSLVAN